MNPWLASSIYVAQEKRTESNTADFVEAGHDLPKRNGARLEKLTRGFRNQEEQYATLRYYRLIYSTQVSPPLPLAEGRRIRLKSVPLLDPLLRAAHE